MTMPHLMNCPHSDTGWCLDCVKQLWEQGHSEELQDLLTQLEAIAAANNDQFSYRIEIEPRHRVMFTFVCEEKTEEARFVSGNGTTIEEAVKNAQEWVETRKTEWNYT